MILIDMSIIRLKSQMAEGISEVSTIWMPTSPSFASPVEKQNLGNHPRRPSELPYSQSGSSLPPGKRMQKARTLSEVKLEHLEPTWFSDTWTHFEHFEHFEHWAWHPMKQANNFQAAPTKFWPSYVLNRHLLTWPHGIHQLSIAGALPPLRNALEDEAQLLCKPRCFITMLTRQPIAGDCTH